MNRIWIVAVQCFEDGFCFFEGLLFEFRGER